MQDALTAVAHGLRTEVALLAADDSGSETDGRWIWMVSGQQADFRSLDELSLQKPLNEAH